MCVFFRGGVDVIVSAFPPAQPRHPGCHPHCRAALLRPGSRLHLWAQEAMSCGYWNCRLTGHAAKFPQQPQFAFQPHFPENTHLAGGPRSLSRGCPSSAPRTSAGGHREDSRRGERCSVSEPSVEDAPTHVCPQEPQRCCSPWDWDRDSTESQAAVTLI